MRRTIGTSIVMMLALLLGLSVMANAAVSTIVVTPSTMDSLGWRYTATAVTHPPTQVGASCAFSVAPTGTTDVPGYGEGAFWGNTGNYAENDKVNQVFLGTNNYSGVKLSDITKLYYRSFTADFETFMAARYSRTPWQLQLAISKNASGTNPTRYLMYRGWDGVADDSSPTYPYQQKCVPYSGEFPYDGKYMVFNGQDCYTGGNGAWVDFVGVNYDLTKPFVGDWPNVLRKYAGGQIMEGSGYYPGTWYHQIVTGENPNLTCLSFVLGNPHNEAGVSLSLSWGDNFKVSAWLDYFVIGYNKNGDPAQYTEDWIYFRPDPTPGKVAMNNSATYDRGILNNPLGSTGNTVVVFGTVDSIPAPSSRLFRITDGSGSGEKVSVKLLGDGMEFPPDPGAYVRVEGVLHTYGAPGSPSYIFVHPDDVIVVQEAIPQ